MEKKQLQETFEKFRADLRAFIELSLHEDEMSWNDWLQSAVKKLESSCWEKKQCQQENCPAYKSTCGRCWLIAGTMCATGEAIGHFAKKYKSCQECDVYREAVYKDSLTEIEEHLIVLVHSLRAKQHELKEMATTDFLTGLHNRRYFDLFINREIKRAKRSGAELVFMMVDINGFKKINDEFGHVYGDFILKECARLLTMTSRESDLVTRYGGDEFLLVLQSCGQEQIILFVARLRDQVRNWNERQPDKRCLLSVSIGTATYCKDDDLEGIIKEADRNMYLDKERFKQGLPPLTG